MKALFNRFNSDSRGAVMLVFALTLVPLILLIALTIDFSFFTEARSQIQLAADAAATHAVRAATGTYALETTQGVANQTAQSDAVAAGETAGSEWFQSQLGQLPSAYVPASANGQSDPNVIVTPTTDPTGFSAAVGYDGIYPPFFNHLFQKASCTTPTGSTCWNIAGNSGAAAQYSYVEILMLLDTSNSMLLGADPDDIATMSDDTVCMNPSVVPTIVAPPTVTQYTPATTPAFAGDFGMINTNNGGVNGNINYEASAADGNQVTWTSVPHYTPGPNGYDGTCKNDKSGDYQVPAFGPTYFPGNNGYAGSPCALACHVANTKLNGQYPDLYGFDRTLTDPDGSPVQFRLDVVLQSAETVIQSMIDSEETDDQFSVGLYQFTNDVSVLANGAQGAPGDSAGDTNYEATYNLNAALTAVQSVDYTVTPSETALPHVIIYDDGNTNFPNSVTDLVNGTATNNTPLAPVTLATEGDTAANPQKDIFIVTDGMEDSCSIGAGCTGRFMGEMTGVAAENGTSSANPAICKLLKNKGFTVYVLYVTYYPPPTVSFYYSGFASDSDVYTNADYPSIEVVQPTILNGGERDDTQPANITGVPPINASFPDDSPDASALRACASSNADFYEASDSTEISNAMSAMLKSALSSAIRVTN